MKNRQLILSLIFVITPIIMIGQLTFEHITNKNGLSHNTVYDIRQDAQGFMWFATIDGLNRYDGKNIKQYFSTSEPNSLPSNSTICLATTENKTLYIGTTRGLAKYRPETDDFETIIHNNQHLGEIIAMAEGLDSKLLLTTVDKGALLYDTKKGIVTPIKLLKGKTFGMSRDKEGYYWIFSRNELVRFDDHLNILASYKVNIDNFNSSISYIKCDSKGLLWVGTFHRGLFVYNYHTKKFSSLESTSNIKMYYVRSIEEGQNANEYWVGTENGMYVLNIQNGSYQHYTQSFDYSLSSINDNSIYKIYKNSQKIMFIGTYFGGVNKAQNKPFGFKNILPSEKNGSLHGKAISQIAKANDNELWFATEDMGIAIYNLENKKIEHLTHDENNPKSIPSNNVHALLMDGNTCWAGHFMGGMSKINIKTREIERLKTGVNDSVSLSNEFVFSIFKYSSDSLFIGMLGGLDVYNKKTGRFSKFRENEITDSFIYEIFRAPDNTIWICSYNNGIFIYDPKSKGLMTHMKQDDRSNLPSNHIISYLIDSKKRIWIGTRGGGLCLFDDKQKTFRVYNSTNDNNLLINNVIYQIQEDDFGNYWISSNKGISKINFDKSTATHFNYRHGLSDNQFNFKSSFRDDNGTMYFGNVSGVTYFHPDLVTVPKEIPSVRFTDFQIFNSSNSTKDNSLYTNIDFAETVYLDYDQNYFNINFICIDYLNNDISYQYYLEGLETEWSPNNKETQVSYTNLSPGKYIFHLKAKNDINNLESPERSFIIIIKPPFWRTWWAYCIYGALLVSILYYFYRSYKKRQETYLHLTIEKIERENIQLLHKHKMNFFTYISHELKTPLSIIIASIEMLMQNSILIEKDEAYSTIKRSATKLLTLINQLMDFQKIETDHATIDVSKADIIEFANQVINAYQPLLRKKNIHLKTQFSYSQKELYFDFDKLEKITTNLISNAIKFTPGNGNINIDLLVGDGEIIFSIQDSGKGLEKDEKEKIFEAFYSKHIANKTSQNSGIGLALTASLVKLLQGKIEVESEVDQGTKFEVTLPLRYNCSTPENIYEVQSESEQIESELTIEQEKSSIIDDDPNHSDFPLVVIAEDNNDLLSLLNDALKGEYQLKCFCNGLLAWQFIQKKTPDIVITDIMMPEMDGIELCEKIKSEINSCHVPVIMLTAKESAKVKMESLSVGADVYIPKPFSMEELKIRVKNVLTMQNNLKVKLKELAILEKIEIPKSNHELLFIEKVYQIVCNNLSNPEMDVQLLVDELNISRTNLHNKVKKTINMSVIEFINTVRINKAKKMMLNSEMTISEVAFEVGFNDAGYFNKVFKKIAGMTPGQFRKME